MNEKLLSDYNEQDSYKGELITTLYAAKPEYLIFEGDKCGTVTVATDNTVLRKRCSAISTKISVISEYLVTRQEKRKFVDQIGLAYVESIEGNAGVANKICDKLIERIEQYKSNIGRFYYLLSCLCVVVIVIIFSYLLKRFQFIPEIIPHFFFMTYAAIGGFLSVSMDIKKVQIEASDFGYFQVIYGSIRILIAMLSGLIMFVLLKSELIFPRLDGSDDYYVICLLAIVAGFSESMIPNLLKKVEDNKMKSDKASTQNTDN